MIRIKGTGGVRGSLSSEPACDKELHVFPIASALTASGTPTGAEGERRLTGDMPGLFLLSLRLRRSCMRASVGFEKVRENQGGCD